MDCFRLQLGCLVTLIYVAVVYFQGCAKYHCRITASHFWKFLAVGIAAVIFDGATAWVTGNASVVPSVWSYICHSLSYIGIDAAIFFLYIYLLSMVGQYSKKNKLLLHLPLIVNIILIFLTNGIADCMRGEYTKKSAGTALIVCFVTVGIYFSAIFLTFFVDRKNYYSIRRDKRQGVITFLTAYLIMATIQMIFAEEIASMSIGVTILVLGIYLNSEDPAIKELGRYYSETVMSFANLIEERDGSTGGHIKRTSRYVGLILEGLRESGEYKKTLTKDYMDNLIEAASMHDIGKIAIPDAILKKPGKLNDEEYAVMKTHAENGGKIITETFGKFLEKDYCDMAYQVARFHHEKWNGKGYPEGLKGEEIPLAARIMAVADVFDAVSEKRCYRDAMPLEKCFEIIKQGRGEDFDPAVVDAFMSLRGEVEKTHEELGK